MTPFRISDIRYVLGENPIHIEDERTVVKTGISTVYRTDTDAYSLAFRAALNVTNDVDVLIYVTQSPTWLLGSHACRLQHDLGMKTSVLAFDIGQGCSGFVQALTVMASLLTPGQRGMIVTADNYPAKDLTPDTACLFSAGAAATIIDTNNPTHRIVAQEHYTDGSGANHLTQRVGQPLYMSGRDVYLFTKNIVAPQIHRVAGDGERIDLALLHQASKPVLDGLALALNPIPIPVDLTHGNTVSSTIPILIKNHVPNLWLDSPRASRWYLMSGFGVGLSASTILMEPV